MKPYYSDDYVTLYHGDCLKVTEWLAADVLVTDPPYGIAWEIDSYITRGRSAGNRSTPHAGIQNDDDTSARDAVLERWGNKPALVFGDPLRTHPRNTRRMLVWHKPADSGFMGQTIWRKDWEAIFMVGKWPTIKVTRSSIIRTRYGSHRGYAQGVHPHAKPLDVMEQLIAATPGTTVADPFAGSGSTLVAAKRLGRRAIGVELEEKYCEIAAQRLSQDVLDLGALTNTPDPTATLIV